jgi:hypothetical protein
MSLFTNPDAKSAKRATLQSLVDNYIASGNSVVVCTTYKSKKPKTFRSSYGAWGQGAKSVSLRDAGVARGR